jgi:small-conductance mechanosensitive channel
LASQAKSGGSLRRHAFLLVVYILLYVVVAAATNDIITRVLPDLNVTFPQNYVPYINILLALAFGYLIVNGFASVVYWSVRVRLPHSTASAVKNMLRLVGFGGLAAAIAGGVAGGAAGVALGGFLGLVVGTATQNVLGQAVAGLFLLMSRPFKSGDRVNISSEEGTVDEVTTLFTVIIKEDGTKVLVPNNSVVGTKISIRPEKSAGQST